MGKLVEAVAHVPRQIGYTELASDTVNERVVVDQVLSRGELLQKLVAKSPTAEIVKLHIGAATSLIPSSLYYEHLTGFVKGLQSIGTFLKIVGVNDIDVLMKGYLGVSL